MRICLSIANIGNWNLEITTMRITKYVRQKLFIQNDNDKVPSVKNVLFSLFLLFSQKLFLRQVYAYFKNQLKHRKGVSLSHMSEDQSISYHVEKDKSMFLLEIFDILESKIYVLCFAIRMMLSSNFLFCNKQRNRVFKKPKLSFLVNNFVCFPYS